jgi:toxin FitB
VIILETNVVSEPLRSTPDQAVVAWLDDQTIETLYLTTVSLGEVRLGIAVLPAGRRRRALHQRFEESVVPAFADRILSFDEPASASYAILRARARANGRAIAVTDGFIAAIAHAHGFTVATRDTGPFDAAEVPVINPFEPLD